MPTAAAAAVVVVAAVAAAVVAAAFTATAAAAVTAVAAAVLLLGLCSPGRRSCWTKKGVTFSSSVCPIIKARRKMRNYFFSHNIRRSTFLNLIKYSTLIEALKLWRKVWSGKRSPPSFSVPGRYCCNV